MKEKQKQMIELNENIIMPRDLPIPVDKFQIEMDFLSKASLVVDKQEFPDDNDCHLWISVGPKNSESQILEIATLPCVDTIRINSQKYGSVEDLAHRIEFIRNKSKNIKICVDLSGPKIRTTKIEELYGRDNLNISKGQKICFIDEKKYQEIGQYVDKENRVILFNNPFELFLGDRTRGFVLASDGWQQFSVEKGNQYSIFCRALHDCNLYNGRGISMSGMYDDVDPITDEVKSLIGEFSCKNIDVDYLGLSFVNRKEDVEKFRKLIKSYGIKSKIISKIETLTGVNNIDEISQSSDLIMLARGDLAVELAHLGIDTLKIEDKVRESCDRNSKECVIATRVADYLAEGGGDLAIYEKARILHELSLKRPSTLMMANETMNDPNAVINIRKTLNTIGALVKKYYY